MKASGSNRGIQGVTRFEVMVVVLVVFLLAIVLLPALLAARAKKHKIDCTNNLMQVGLSFRIWEGDHHDKYPMSISVTNGGVMESVAAGNPVPAFQAMSNELIRLSSWLARRTETVIPQRISMRSPRKTSVTFSIPMPKNPAPRNSCLATTILKPAACP